MLLRFPFAAWFTLSAALVAAGAFVRFDGTYLVVDQLILGLLFFVAAFMLTVGLICWLPLLRRVPDGRAAGIAVFAFVAAPALAMVLLVSLAFEHPATSAARHRDHLLRVARIVLDDAEARGRMPVLLDDALRRSREAPSHRGDADGGPLAYRRLDPDTALLCAPDRRVHVLIDGGELRYLPWPPGRPDPCASGSPSSYWADHHRTEAGHHADRQ